MPVKTIKMVTESVGFFALIFVLMLLALSVAHGITPSFEKAKAIAIHGTPNAKGDNFVWRDVNEEGTVTRYVVGYLPNNKLIGLMIIKGSVKAIVVFGEETGVYEAGLYADGTLVQHKFISEEDAEQFAALVIKNF